MSSKGMRSSFETGQKGELAHAFTRQDVEAFARLSGDTGEAKLVIASYLK